MQFEIDYLPVGEGERGGDAIALRFGDDLNNGRQSVVVIDGGTKDSGAALVSHIKTNYRTNGVDIVVCSHPDCDHASGLTVVLEQLNVGALVMHRPWEHVDALREMFRRPRVTPKGLERKLVDALSFASELEDIAARKKIPIYEPFAGLTAFNGVMHVLGPSTEWYRELVCQFDCTREPRVGLLTPFIQKAPEAVRWLSDAMHLNLLDDLDRTSPQNNSSAIVLFQIDGRKLLFTGDAGITSLCAAADYAQSLGMSLADLMFLDVPHHGSKRNAGRTAYSRIKSRIAFISAPKDSAKHPSKKVMNALAKNGTSVFVTRGMPLIQPYNIPMRVGYIPLSPEPFHSQVEE